MAVCVVVFEYAMPGFVISIESISPMMSTVNVALSFVPSVLSFANSLLIEISALKKSSLLVTVMPVTGPAIVVVPSAVTLPVYDAGGDENATDGGLLYPIPPVLRLTLLTAPELIVRVEPDNVPYAIGLVIVVPTLSTNLTKSPSTKLRILVAGPSTNTVLLPSSKFVIVSPDTVLPIVGSTEAMDALRKGLIFLIFASTKRGASKLSILLVFSCEMFSFVHTTTLSTFLAFSNVNI